jgi:hypothetical protein
LNIVAGLEKSICSGLSGDFDDDGVLPLISLMQWVIHAGWIGVSPLTDSSFFRQPSRSVFQLSRERRAALVDAQLRPALVLSQGLV